jgi:hypothetical protein
MSKERIENLEHLEIMEDKFGISIEGLYAEIERWDDLPGQLPNVNIYGEVHASNGTGINENICIVATAFNKEGKVIGASEAHIYQEDFFAIEPLQILINDIVEKPSKIRIYPKKA